MNTHYTAVAIVLHWAIAAAIIANIALGWWMHGAIDAAGNQSLAVAAFQAHKSIGLTVMALSLLRLAWRLVHPPPPLPDSMPRWEQQVAKLSHWAFYTLMLAVPLAGWLYVSTQWRHGEPLQVPTLWFGLFEVPHLFGLDHASETSRATLAGLSFDVHKILAWSTAALLGLHIAAALKHQFVDRDTVLARMLPMVSKDTGAGKGRRFTLYAGMAAIVVAAAAIVLTQFELLDSGATRTPANITAAEGSWAINSDQSAIHFSGVHAGNPFRGQFQRWQIGLQINEADVTASKLSARIATASATDGVALHDKTLPQAEWFDSDNYPYARYQASRIEPLDNGDFAVTGSLRIKGNSIDVPRLTLELNQQRAVIHGQFVIDREAADLGMQSDPKGRWVSREIQVEVRAELTQCPE